MAEVVIDRATKRFGDVAAIKDVSLTVPNGELVVLLGPTGAGKTTLLRLVAGLEKPDAGIITIDGRDAPAEPPALRDVSFVFQQYSLYPHLTVYDTLAFPLRAPARRGDAAVGRRDAARRDRPRARTASRHLPDGRAVVIARCQASRRAARGAEAHPGRPRRDHALRHARSDRSDDDGEPYRHTAGRMLGASRHAA